MNDIRLVEGLATDRVNAAKKRVNQAVRSGQPVTVEDLAAMRGLVAAERENSIFSDAWVPLAVLLVVVGYFAGRNVPAMTLGLILLFTVAISHWWKNRALQGVLYQRSFDRTHVFPGEPVLMKIKVKNHKQLPLTWLQFQDMIAGPAKLTLLLEDGRQSTIEVFERFGFSASFAPKPFDELERQLIIQFAQRGFYRIGPTTYRAGDIFTLFTVEREYLYEAMLVVYPKVWPLEALGLPPKEPFGDVKIQRSLFTDPLRTRGIRDYQPQDSFRDVHWKATARTGNLQTKIYDPSTGMTMALFLNVATSAKYWMGSEPELLERLITVSASILNYGFEQKWGIGVYANGSVPRSDQAIKVRPGRSPDQLMFCLEGLAAVTGFATGDMERLLQEESRKLPWIATLVVVTALLNEELVVTLIRLKEAGRRIVLISLAETPPPNHLGNISCYHIPPTAAAFQHPQGLRTVTEAALQNVPAPEPFDFSAKK